MMIMKMQRSLASTEAKTQVLIYNESRTVMLEQEMPPELAKWFGSKDKVYAKASFKKGQLTILGLVKAQAW